MNNGYLLIGKRFDVNIKMEPFKNDTKYINVNGEMYQVTVSGEKEKRSFIISRQGETLCRLSRDEKGKWKPDCDIGDHLLAGFVKWIRLHYE